MLSIQSAFYYLLLFPMFYTKIVLFPLHPVVSLFSCILHLLVGIIFFLFFFFFVCPVLFVLLYSALVSFESPFFNQFFFYLSPSFQFLLISVFFLATFPIHVLYFYLVFLMYIYQPLRSEGYDTKSIF